MKLRDAKLKAVVRRCSIKKVFCKKAVLRNFVRFTGKHLCQRLSQAWPATLLKKSLWYRCFPVNFAKFLRTPFLQNISGGCFCKLQVNEKNSFTHTPSCILPSFLGIHHFFRIHHDYFFQRGFESVRTQFLSGNINGK